MILEGLRVVELGTLSAGASISGMLLADAGAHVIKIEPPEGDGFRTLHPSGFLAWNRGKDSMVADLRELEGQEQARALIASADVVIDGLGPGVADGWGLGSEAMSVVNPGLIYGSIKAFGPLGHHASLKGYEGVAAAKAGLYTTVRRPFRQGPVFIASPFLSIGAAHQLVGGILGALKVRDSTGVGQRVDATLVQGLQPFDYFGSMQWQLQHRAGNAATPTKVAAERYGLRPCTKDGRWVLFSTMLTHQCHALLRALDMEYVLDDDRFHDAPRFSNAEDAQDYEDLIGVTFREHDLAHWLPRLLAENDVAFEPLGSCAESLKHPQLIHNGGVLTIHDAAVGQVREVAPVPKFSRTPLRVQRSAPALGQHDRWGERVTQASSNALPPHPLSDITIVEFGYFMAMPLALTMAGAMGARVIKLEDHRGDPMRWSFGVRESGAAKTTEGKESISLDLSTPEGREIAHRLIAKADAFVIGFRPGVASRLGLDEATLRALNPTLLYCNAMGYGVDGPYAQRALYAGAIAGFAGGHFRQAGAWLEPERASRAELDELEVLTGRMQPTMEGDAFAGISVFVAMMLGLLERSRSKAGQSLVTTMLNANAFCEADDAIVYDGKPPLSLPDPDMYGFHALYRIYEAEGGWIFLAAIRALEWRALLRCVDSEELATDPRFTTEADRKRHDAELINVLSERFLTKSADHWEDVLSAGGVGCGKLASGTMAEVTCTDAELRENGQTAVVDHPLFGTIVRHGVPVRFSRTPGRLAPGCLLGQHTRALLREVGYDEEQIASLEAQDVVHAYRPEVG